MYLVFSAMYAILLQSAIFLFIPALLLFLEKKVKVISWIGPVILAYIVGIVLGNLPFIAWDQKAATLLYEICAVLAVPLVLFSANLRIWMRLAPKTLLSYGFCIVGALAASTAAYFIAGKNLPESSKYAGMAVGVYTGGTPNLTAIGIALGVEGQNIARLNIADTIVCVPYLILCFAGLQYFLQLFLPKFDKTQVRSIEFFPYDWASLSKGSRVKGVLLSLGLALGCLGLSMGLAELLPIERKDAIIVSTVTLLGLLASMVPKIRSVAGSYETGEYLLLTFCVAVGAQMRWDLFTQSLPELILFMAISAWGAILIHFILAYFFKIDADTVLITSVAGIFSPVFVAPIAHAINNRQIIPSGMTTGVIGFAIGNFLGLTLSWILDLL